MDSEKVKSYFNNGEVVLEYARASVNVGLWESEKIVFKESLKPDMKILELGCGAGRIARGLFGLGFKNVVATDFSQAMVESAKIIFEDFKEDIPACVCDATDICFPDSSYDAAVFGFNGLMQIPKASGRLQAAREVFRILKAGGIFIFTTHDRDAVRNSTYWEGERRLWNIGQKNAELDEFGDIYYKSDTGGVFIHSPTHSEIFDMLTEAGFEVESRRRRSDMVVEPPAVREFSDDCIFWVANKPSLKNS